MTSEGMNVIDMDIADLELSVRSYNSLKRAGIDTVGQLVELSDDELLKLKNFGVRCLNEVHGKLASYYRRKQTYAELEQENVKLRELVARLIACVDTISNSDTFYYQPRRDGCGIDCTANGEHCSLIKMCDQARKLGIEVAE